MAATVQTKRNFTNTLYQGDCIEIMLEMPAESTDFILTDPPYLVNYRDRIGRFIQNDGNDHWLKPAMKEAHRVLKHDRVAVMFYGWTAVDKFFAAWREAGFRPVGHLVFRKSYASKSRLVRYQHDKHFCWPRDNLHCRRDRSLTSLISTTAAISCIPRTSPCRLWFH